MVRSQLQCQQHSWEIKRHCILLFTWNLLNFIQIQCYCSSLKTLFKEAIAVFSKLARELAKWMYRVPIMAKAHRRMASEETVKTDQETSWLQSPALFGWKMKSKLQMDPMRTLKTRSGTGCDKSDKELTQGKWQFLMWISNTERLLKYSNSCSSSRS